LTLAYVLLVLAAGLIAPLGADARTPADGAQYELTATHTSSEATPLDSYLVPDITEPSPEEPLCPAIACPAIASVALRYQPQPSARALAATPIEGPERPPSSSR